MTETEADTVLGVVNKYLPKIRAEKWTMKDVYDKVSAETGWPPTMILRVHRGLASTTNAATQLFRARAVRMAQKVLRKADPAQLIDILSRPNIGVLEPIKKEAAPGAGGFFLSVQAEACGAVNVAVSPTLPAPLQLREAEPSPQPESAPTVECNDYTLEDEPAGWSQPEPQTHSTSTSTCTSTEGEAVHVHVPVHVPVQGSGGADATLSKARGPAYEEVVKQARARLGEGHNRKVRQDRLAAHVAAMEASTFREKHRAKRERERLRLANKNKIKGDEGS